MSKKLSWFHVGAVVGLLGAGLFCANSPAVALVAPAPAPVEPVLPAGQDGQLDRTFGVGDNDGIDGYTRTTSDIDQFAELLGQFAAQQTDGKILTLSSNVVIGETGSIQTSSDDSVVENLDPFNVFKTLSTKDTIGVAATAEIGSFILRHNFDGSPDTSFGDNGSVSIEVEAETGSLALTITLQQDGKILVAGVADPYLFLPSTVDSSASQPILTPFVLRLLEDGSPDPSFGDNGVVIVDIGASYESYASDVLVQEDNKIVLTGIAQEGGQPTSPEIQAEVVNKTFVTRLLPSGALDVEFADGGTHFRETGFNNGWLGKVHLQDDGKLVVTGLGIDDVDNNSATFVYRLGNDGELDRNYGDDGVLQLATESFYAIWGSSMMQPDGKLLIVDFSNVSDSYNSRLYRVTKDGALDPTFGDNGLVLISDADNRSFVVGGAIQPDGKIVLTALRDNTFVVYRLTTDGSLDSSFGNAGSITFDWLPDALGIGVSIQPNGQILISGINVSEDVTRRGDFLMRLDSAKPVTINGLAPSRLFDTRTDSPQGSIPVEKIKYGASTELRVNVAGQSGLAQFGIGAAVLNITVTEPEDSGYITVYPCGSRPLASNLNFVKDQTVSTAVTTRISPIGEVCIYSSVKTNLIADVNAWSARNAGYASLVPERLLDTRVRSPHGSIVVDKKKFGTTSELRVKVAGKSGLPDGRLSSVSLNMTVTEPENDGYLTVYPCGDRPLASNLNFVADQTISTSVTTPVSAAGEICIYSSAQTNLVADIFGWFVEGSGMTAVNPTRLVDTRIASPQGAITVDKKLYSNTDELRLSLPGKAGLPADGIGTALITVTVTDPATSGFITVYPCGTRPLASNLNYVKGQTIAASVTAQVSDAGEVCVYSQAPANIIVDINGWGNKVLVG